MLFIRNQVRNPNSRVRNPIMNSTAETSNAIRWAQKKLGESQKNSSEYLGPRRNCHHAAAS